MKQIIKEFGGLITEVDEAVNPGAVDILNWDITYDKTLRKSKGCVLNDEGSLYMIRGYTFTKVSSQITNMTLTFATDPILASGESFLFPDFTFIKTNIAIADDFLIDIESKINSKLLISDSAGSFSVSKNITVSSGITVPAVISNIAPPENMTKNICTISRNLFSVVPDYTNISDITNYGSFSDIEDDRIYSFIGCDSTSKNYLCYTDKDNMNWNFFEGASAGLCTDFDISHDAQFVKDGNEIVLVKGESKTIASQVGGCFTLNTASQTIELYGTENCPTATTIEKFGERLYVGNISKQEAVPQNGESWVQVSKKYPEKTDTTSTIAASGSVVGEHTTINFGASHSFNRSEYVFVTGVSSNAGTEVLNGDYWKITEVASQSIIIDVDTTDKDAIVDGTVILRGNTWTPSYVEFDGLNDGGGMFRCDDNVDDGIVVLKKNFGSLFILRDNNPYVLSGDFSSGTLAKQLNIPYKTLSKSTALTADGFYFVSNFGLSMVDGQVIKDNPNQFDNIGSNLPTELIKTRFNDIINKDKCVLNFNNRYVWLHDQDYNYTYSFDTVLKEWTVYSGKLATQFFNIDNDIYSINGLFIFKHDNGYNYFDQDSLGYKPLQSTYKTRIYNQDEDNKQKQYNLLYALLEGVNSSDDEVNLDVQILYNSEASPRRTVSYDIKTGDNETWLGIATETEIWTDIATLTETWEDIVGSDIVAIERGTARLGTAKQIQLIFNHNTANDGKISKMMLDYDIIDIGTFRST